MCMVKIQGIKKEYHKDGTLWYETPYVDDKQQGIEKHYHKDGTPDREAPYVDGKRKWF